LIDRVLVRREIALRRGAEKLFFAPKSARANLREIKRIVYLKYEKM